MERESQMTPCFREPGGFSCVDSTPLEPQDKQAYEDQEATEMKAIIGIRASYLEEIIEKSKLKQPAPTI